jgi:hypothetical protein
MVAIVARTLVVAITPSLKRVPEGSRKGAWKGY